MVTLEFHTVTQTPVYVPTGTTFDSSLSGAPSNLTFQTMQDYVIPAGVVTAKVEVYCTTVGSKGTLLKVESIVLLTTSLT
ncbi:baseplate J/gp47 family protein [Enterococcus faecium]|nr:baseplate J/gp47 family protein [Enterococcus faecium]